jgi:integrase
MNTYRLQSNGKYWRIQFTAPTGHVRKVSAGLKSEVSRVEAEAYMHELIATHAAQPGQAHEQASGCTLGLWLEVWLARRERDVAASTHRNDKSAADHLLEYFASHVRLADLSRGVASRWRESMLDAGLAEATVCKVCRTVKVCMKDAVAIGEAFDNPFDHLKVTAPVKDVNDRELVDRETVDAIMDVAGHAEPVIALCYWAGLRTAEAVNLHWDDVDLDAGRITIVPREGIITTKQRRRIVRVEPELLEYLTRREATDFNRFDTVCAMADVGRAGMVWDYLRKARTLLRIGEEFTYQNLRRTRSTIWFSNFPSHVAAAWMGHSEDTARKHYLSVPNDLYIGGAV